MTQPYRLVRHPECAEEGGRSVEVLARRLADGSLHLRYTLAGDMAGIAVPEMGEPARADGLWRHTCFECFVTAGGDAYLEFNFSPSRAWAAYAFSGYRRPAAPPPDFDAAIAVTRSADRLTLEASIPAAQLPSMHPLRAGYSAVIERASGALTYWALHHAPGRPDFHRAEAFVAAL